MSYAQEFKNVEKHFFDKKESEKFSFNDKPFYYVVPMFPYPSGNIHMGHIRVYSVSQAFARYKKSQGFNVLHPIGFDSFGMPAEGAAIKHSTTAKAWTEKNIETMTADFKAMNFDFDWEHGVKTHEFEYYKYEQDVFKKALNAGIIYKKEQFVNFDPVDNTILANEQVINGKGWRSGAEVVRKRVPMYFIDIRRYAIELSQELEGMRGNWPDKVIEMQKNWIGVEKSKVYTIDFKSDSTDDISGINGRIEAHDINYSIEPENRAAEDAPNAIAIGADNEFAKKWETNAQYSQWFKTHSQGSVSQKHNFKDKSYFETSCQVNVEGKEYSVVIDLNLGDDCIFINRDEKKKSHEENTNEVNINESKIQGQVIFKRNDVHIKLKDWGISRQRYWGSPIPMIECAECGDVKSPDYVRLPENITPSLAGNALKQDKDFTVCECPHCGKPAQRCTDTMDTFVQSSWYYHRYIQPQSEAMIPKKDSQIDLYIGGIEHATMHLIYTRAWHKMLRDLGYVNTDEPVKKLITQGMVCKKYIKNDGKTASAKMSKSLGNVVAPGPYIQKYGSDAVAMFMIFAAPPTVDFDFDSAGIVGSYRFLNEIYNFFFPQSVSENGVNAGQIATRDKSESEAQIAVENMVKYIQREFEGRGNLNTVIPQLMTTFKIIKKTDFKSEEVKEQVLKEFARHLAIFAPSLGEYIIDYCFEAKLKDKPGDNFKANKIG